MPKQKKTNVFTIFSGYPATLIERWCAVSKATAYAYKSAKRAPSRPVSKLFRLFARGKVLGNAWDGWSVRDGVLFSPEGYKFSPYLLRAYPMIIQLARTRDSDSLNQVLQDLKVAEDG